MRAAVPPNPCPHSLLSLLFLAVPRGWEVRSHYNFYFHFSNDCTVSDSDGHGVSFWGAENVLELDAGDAYTVAIS